MAEQPLNDTDYAYLRYVEFGELPPRVRPDEYVELIEADNEEARLYRGNLRETLNKDRAFWQQVQTRARKLYHKFHGRWPHTPFDAST